ncbi:MAG TPA: hypothetical protein VK348_09815 [Planctomycetota bacterium]|nr:hypothetical protein [Planctomycetota bacterium]
MINEPHPGGSTLAQMFVEDLFLTDSFLVKGRMVNKIKRLTNLLEDHARTFLHVQDATMVSLRSSDVIRTPSVMINVREVICAHELVDVAGDEVLKKLAAQNKTVRIRAFYNGAVQFEMSGNVEPEAYETGSTTNRKYFIMQKPVLRGLNLELADLRILKTLEYAIVRKDKMAYVYDFSAGPT